MKYIFQVHIKDGHTAEEYAEAWVKASKIIQRAPGAKGTELHRKIGDEKTLIAIASWDTKAQRDAMEGQHNPEVAEIIRSAAPFCDITPLGEFEDPDWVVLPSRVCLPLCPTEYHLRLCGVSVLFRRVCRCQQKTLCCYE